MRVYGLNSRRLTSQVAGEGKARKQYSLPRSLARALRGRASRASRRRHQLQVLCRCDVGERRGDSKPWRWHDAVQFVRVVKAQ